MKYCAKLGATAPPAITLLASGYKAHAQGMGSNSVEWSGSESLTSDGLYEEPGAETYESESVETNEGETESSGGGWDRSYWGDP